MSLVSCLMLTLNRYTLTRKTLEHNLKNSNGANIELLIADNGSSDKQVVEWLKYHPKVTYHRANSQNEGCSRAFNQLYLRAKGDYICLLGNDIELPKGWCQEMVKYAAGVPNSGIIGMDWGHGGVPPLSYKLGSHAHWLNERLDKVFGVWMMRRKLIEDIGFFHEGFHPYGLEDSDFNNRVNIGKYNSCYVPNTHFKSTHIGTGNEDSGPYREMKNKSLEHNLPILHDRCANYKTRGIVEPLPPLREPL